MQGSSGGDGVSRSSPPGGRKPPGNGRATLRVRFARPDDLRHFHEHQTSRGPFVRLHTRRDVPPGTPVDVVLSVGSNAGTLRLKGVVAPSAVVSAEPSLLVQLADAAGASEAVSSFIAYVDSLHLLTAPKPSERRIVARLSVTVPVWLRFANEDAFRDHYTRDVSPTGLFVFADLLHPVSTSVEVLLVVPGSDDGFVLPSAVARVVPGDATGRRAGMGLRFDPMAADAKEDLDSYLRALLGLGEPEAALAPLWSRPPSRVRRVGAKGGPSAVASRPPKTQSGGERRARVVLRPSTAERFCELFLSELRPGRLFVRSERAAASGAPVDVVLTVPESDETFQIEGIVEGFVASEVPGARGGSVIVRLRPLGDALERAIGATADRLLAERPEPDAEAPRPPKVSVRAVPPPRR